MKQNGGFLLLVVLDVDEFLITDGSSTGLRNIKSVLSKAFSVTDVGILREFNALT